MKNNITSLAKERRKRKPRTPEESAKFAKRRFFGKTPVDLIEPDSLASGGDMAKILEQVDDNDAPIIAMNGIHPIVSEYNLLWEALKHYDACLEKLSSMATDEDRQLKYNEKIQDLEGILNSIKIAAKNDYDLVLE